MKKIEPRFREFRILDKQNNAVNDYHGLLKAEEGLEREMYPKNGIYDDWWT